MDSASAASPGPLPPEPKEDIDLPSWLAYLYAPIVPLLKGIRIKRAAPRQHKPADIRVPGGYEVELVTGGLNAPVHCCFDEQGFCYVTEAGHKIESKPRILRVDTATGRCEPFFELSPEKWVETGAVTGACWHQGYLYVTNTSTLFRVDRQGHAEDLITDLPGWGDHQTNYPVVGPDGKIYFGVGTATNNGVVGADNFAYEWLQHFPEFCDVPGQDVVLAGRNYEFKNVLGDLRQTVRTGAYVPFGTETRQGQVIKGQVKCSGSVLCYDPDTDSLEVVAWGLRNPYGLAFAPDGRLFATEHGSDERGARYILGDFDDFYEITQGAWYGWPDFASGIPLNDASWGEGGQGRAPVLATAPDPHPPRPVVSFPQHVGANGLDFCRSEAFGFPGEAFVALFGDLAPITAQRLGTPAGFKVVRVDPRRRQMVDFAVNKIAGPASKLPHQGFERPSHCAFGPDGALYVVDWGEIEIAPEKGGVRMQAESGALWRIRRTDGPPGEQPARPIVLPYYAIQFFLLAGALLLGGIAGLAWLVRRRLRRR